MLKYLFLLLLAACSAPIYSETAPSWVNSLRTGNSTLKITSGDKVLFRTNFKSAKITDREDACDAALKKNEDFIRKTYPRSSVIPMTVELRYFDPVVKDCSTTVSVPRSFKDGDETAKRTIGVQGGNTGVLNLTTAPTDSADVLIDEVPFSQNASDIKIALSAGTHTLRVDHPNYEAFEQKIKILPQSELPVSVKLVPSKVKVTVNVLNDVQPDVYLNDVKQGKTPVSFTVEINQDNVVALRHPEFLEYTIALNAADMRRGDDVNLSAVLMTEKPAYVAFTTDPAGAELFVDGKNIGKTPIKKHIVSRGTHRFETYKNGWFSAQGEFAAAGGKTTAKHVRLTKDGDSRFVVLETKGEAKTAVAVQRQTVDIVARDKYHTYSFDAPSATLPVVPQAATREDILKALTRWDYPLNFLRGKVSYNPNGDFFVHLFFDKEAYETAFFDKIRTVLKQIPPKSGVCKVEHKREWTGQYDSDKYKIYKEYDIDNCNHGVAVAKAPDGKKLKKYKISYLKSLKITSKVANRMAVLTVAYTNGAVKKVKFPIAFGKVETDKGLRFIPSIKVGVCPNCAVETLIQKNDSLLVKTVLDAKNVQSVTLSIEREPR